ncbi:hypothetical protein E2C01_027418 [Portunus trituberculatus]|uniref:Uncharacterized protein n=1 Tax=Portunus trituberculatus TaxID=210409 RepID=A0A5B7EKT1_PORTR|nr:hypothetical protein [Portunus trituberculatus]
MPEESACNTITKEHVPRQWKETPQENDQELHVFPQRRSLPGGGTLVQACRAAVPGKSLDGAKWPSSQR